MNDSEKRRLERAACEYFLASYNKACGMKYQVKEHRDKPDFEVEDTIGLEIMHSFYGDEEAKILLGRSKKKR